MATELGVGYVSIIARTTGMGKSIAADLKQLDPLAQQTGKRMGTALSTGVGKSFDAIERDAEGAAKDTVRAFSSVGERVKAGMTGDFRGAFKRVEGDAATSANRVEREFKDAGDDAGRNFSSGLGSHMKKAVAGLGAAVAAVGIGQVFKDAVKQAGDYEQSIGAIQSVFKDTAGEMFKFAETASTSVGLSKNSYQELATVLGAQLKNGGMALDEIGGKTNSLIGVGADLASMFGGTTKEAVEAMSSALRGESDPIERYGVSLSAAKVEAEALAMGAEKVGKEFSQEAKQAAILSLVMKQTADAQGNFAREADTFAGKQQRMAAQWEDMKVKIGDLFIPALTSAMGLVTNVALPAIGGLTGGLRDAYEAVAPLGEWLNKTKGTWGPFAAGIAIVAGAYGAWTLATTIQTAALWGQAAAFVAANAPIIAVVAGLGLLVGAVIKAYQNIGWFKDAVDGAWSFIRSVTAGLVSWVVGTAFPAIVNAVRVVGNVFSWLNTNIIQPVWQRIRSAISGVANWFTGTIVPNFNKSVNALGKFFDFLYRNFIAPFVFAFRLAIGAVSTWFQNTVVTRFRVAVNVLGNLFRAFKSNVIDPVWNAIRARINLVVTWFRNTLVPIFRNAVQVLQSRFEVFQRGVSTVWDRVKSAGTSAWNVVRTRVFDPMKSGLDKLKAGFEATQRGISTAWGKLRDAVKKPISFVVTKVINPFLTGYNKINNAWSGDDIGLIPGFRTGGYTGRKGRDEVAGVVHGDEHVIRSESRRDIERTNPGLLERLNKQGASALPSFGHEGHAAHGGMAAGGPGGPGTYLWGALQNAIYSSGVAHVRGSAPGYNIPAAARAWNNMSNLKVRYGSGPNQINVGGGAPAGTWGYAWTDGRIALNPGIPAGMKTGTAAHEIGHVLGLDHAGTNSIMHPMMRGPLWPSGYDRQTIQRIYGGSGKGNPPEGGGGGFDIFGAIKKVLSGPLGKLKELLSGGNAFSQMAGGLAKNVVNGIMEKASGGRIDDIWDAPVGTTHALRPGVSSIYNGTGGVEHFKRVDPSDAGNGLVIQGNVYTVDENEFARAVFKKADQRRSLAYVA